ncbi:ATP-binding protein [Fundidesulfovibrio putealis]|uniref:ATP-binding protein n=1 Tax=Fundidesulfovibrio putealis TaxID=270496 RepID=UPI000412F1CC|nr:ATP-binding protein [Fundidesulfovibrio putealis]
MTGRKRVRLTIDSALEHVSMVGNALRGILENEPGPRQDIPLVELAVCEAVNNAIIHGYGRRAGSPVEVDVSLGDGRLDVIVADLGQGFERFPDILPAIPGGDDLEQMPMGGWGLRIMGEVMEAVGYSSARGRNELSMSRRWE